ncbi:MAG: integrase catalytic protein [Spirosoma sp.]|nr:integrase catalytic protein [Spirosoma sp.]
MVVFTAPTTLNSLASKFALLEEEGLKASSLPTDPRPRMLSDNGSAYVSQYLREYLKGESPALIHEKRAATRCG